MRSRFRVAGEDQGPRAAGDVERVLRGLAGAGYSARSLSQSRSVLRRAFRRAERNELASRNVAELAELPAAVTRKSRALTETQVRALLALKLTEWWRAFIITAVMTGMRPGELLGLRWEDVDFDSGVIRVRVSLKRVPAADGGYQLELRELKTERSKRTMTMPAPVRGVLTVLRRVQAADRLRLGAAYDERGLVFCGPTGRPRHNQGVRDHYRRLCKRAVIDRDWNWQLRETRHTFISQLSDSGVDIERIADAAGHVNSNVTRTVYRHQLADKVSEAAGAMDRRYGSVGPSEGGWLPGLAPASWPQHCDQRRNRLHVMPVPHSSRGCRHSRAGQATPFQRALRISTRPGLPSGASRSGVPSAR
jgi:integrase